MNKQLINEAMARLDGIQGTIYADSMQYVNGPFTGSIPTYTESHDAVQRVIDGLDDDQVKDYLITMGEIHGWTGKFPSYFRFLVRATALQKCEAILKAKGLWTKEMEGDV